VRRHDDTRMIIYPKPSATAYEELRLRKRPQSRVAECGVSLRPHMRGIRSSVGSEKGRPKNISHGALPERGLQARTTRTPRVADAVNT